MSSDTDRRPVRSFVIRAGRFTESQRLALQQYWPVFGIDFSPQRLDPEEYFSRPRQPLTVEIGFGMGDSLLEMASREPERNFLGIEVHPPGIGKLLQGLASRELDNVRVLQHDAREVFQHCLPAESLDRVLILFPDPWPKKRHHKRRLIQPDFATLVASRLRTGGQLHVATDWQSYAEQMVEVLENCEPIFNTQGPQQVWACPDRPATKFERRGLRLGHGVWDLLYEKR